MAFEVGERVVAESEATDRRPRSGVVEEVLLGDPSPRYRIRWDDGHEGIYTPASGALRAEQRPKRQRQASRTTETQTNLRRDDPPRPVRRPDAARAADSPIGTANDEADPNGLPVRGVPPLGGRRMRGRAACPLWCGPRAADTRPRHGRRRAVSPRQQSQDPSPWPFRAAPCAARNWNGDGSARTRARRLGDPRCSRGVLGCYRCGRRRRRAAGVCGVLGGSGSDPTSANPADLAVETGADCNGVEDPS